MARVRPVARPARHVTRSTLRSWESSLLERATMLRRSPEPHMIYAALEAYVLSTLLKLIRFPGPTHSQRYCMSTLGRRPPQPDTVQKWTGDGSRVKILKAAEPPRLAEESVGTVSRPMLISSGILALC